jgi:tetratricopeptide (TPR) repeat protein
LSDLNYYELIELKEYDRALEDIESNQAIIDNYSIITSLIKIADIYLELNQKERAIEIIDKALNFSLKTQERYFMGAVSESYIKAKQIEKALQILEESYQIAKTAKNKSLVIGNLMGIAIQYAELGKYNRAIEVTNSIESKPYKARTVAQIALLYAQSEEEIDEQEAMNALNQIKIA